MLELTLTSALFLSIIATYLTNPFARFTIVRLPFRAKLIDRVVQTIDRNDKLKTHQGLLWRWFAIYQSGVYIITTRYINQPKSKSDTVEGIIADIHKLRYNPKKLLLISGDHFNALFVRNLGVFYYPILDRSIASNQKDFNDRQTVYLQTVAYALGVFNKHPELSTTIVSMGPYSATCVDFYSYPSDSLFGILYALAALKGLESAQPYSYQPPCHQLDTVAATDVLLTTYKETLRKLYRGYDQHVFDRTTGLIRTDIHMSGAKDITRRSSAFYDNVIYWKTTQLAMKLGLIKSDQTRLDSLKQAIIDRFWLPDEGHFLEDLSAEGIKNKYYSSDWLIVLSTGFLSPLNPEELQYFVRSVDYIHGQQIDRPFGLKYQQATRAHRQFLAVRIAVASYGGDAIWSFWGMEYIKALTLMYKVTGDQAYADEANYQIKAYEAKMLEYGGFPEVYDANGAILKTLLYKSILETGWVIGFEQARAMYQSLVVDRPKV